MASWNIEWFGDDTVGHGPSDEALQLANVQRVVGDAGADLWCLQEVVGAAHFQQLLASMPSHDGFLSNDSVRVPSGSTWYSDAEQKLGVLFRREALTALSASVILTGYASRFAGRPPLRVDFEHRLTGQRFAVIVLHMKALATQDAYADRQVAGAALKTYLDGLSDPRVLVIGDWNDDVDQSIVFVGGSALATPYQPFIDDSSFYEFPTRVLSLARVRSTVSGPEMIDHQLAVREMKRLLRPGSAAVLRPDWWGIPSYGSTTSDHYPVVASYCLQCGGPDAGGVQLVMNEVLHAEPIDLPLPDGGVGPNYAKEFVELVNEGSTAADLSGWTLADVSRVRHIFPSGSTLVPGAALVIFGGPTGIPPGLDNAVPASSGTLSLHPSDAVELRDAAGVLRDSFAWMDPGPVAESWNRSPDGRSTGTFTIHTTLNPNLSSSPGRRATGLPFP